MAPLPQPSPFIDTAALHDAVSGVSHHLAGFVNAHGAWLSVLPDANDDFGYLQSVVDSILVTKTTGSAIGRVTHALERLQYFQRQLIKRDIGFADEPHLARAAYMLNTSIPTLLERAELYGIHHINDPATMTLSMRFVQLLDRHPFEGMPETMYSAYDQETATEAFAQFDRAMTDRRVSMADKLTAAKEALTAATQLAKATAPTACVGMGMALASFMREKWQALYQDAMRDPEAAEYLANSPMHPMAMPLSAHRASSVF